MRTLPIPALLYSGSLLVAFGAGWLIFESVAASGRKAPPREVADGLVSAGMKRQPPARDWLWDDWWRNLESANVTGKVQEAPLEPQDPPPPDTPLARPLRDLLAVVAITYRGESGNRSHCVVRFAPDAEVEPPRAGSHAAAPVVALASGKPLGAASVPIPLRVQHVNLEDTLWPPHASIRLVAVAPDASSVTFVREDPGLPRESWRRVAVRRIELPLDAVPLTQTLAAVAQERTASRPASPPAERGAASRPESDAGGDTREVRPGAWRVGPKDDAWLREKSGSLLEADVRASSYSAPSGKVRGVMLDQVAPRVRRLGFQPGDIVLEINGVPVRSKAEAAAEAERQYSRGARSFVLGVISRGEIVERRYELPP